MPVRQRLFVGRECGGIAPSQRLIVHDQMVSRLHLEIRLAPEPGSAYVVDTSTNGTRLNGERIQSSVPVPLATGDRLGLGSIELEFEVPGEVVAERTRQRTTVSQVSISKMIMVVGDIANYSAISQRTSPPNWPGPSTPCSVSCTSCSASREARSATTWGMPSSGCGSSSRCPMPRPWPPISR